MCTYVSHSTLKIRLFFHPFQKPCSERSALSDSWQAANGAATEEEEDVWANYYDQPEEFSFAGDDGGDLDAGPPLASPARATTSSPVKSAGANFFSTPKKREPAARRSNFFSQATVASRSPATGRFSTQGREEGVPVCRSFFKKSEELTTIIFCCKILCSMKLQFAPDLS